MGSDHMATQTMTGETDEPLLDLPAHPLGYLAIAAAIVSAVVHLLLSTRVMGFNQTLGVLFLLNGIGMLGGVLVYLSRYWRRSHFLVAAAYAVATIIAFFGFQGFSVDAFYLQGDLNPFAVAAKAAELLLALTAVYLYSETGQ